jgi:hypothetical protein
MATTPLRWGDGTKWDSGAVWNGVRIIPEKTKMAQAVLNISRLSQPDFIKRAYEIKVGMTGNPTITTPAPTVAAVGLLITSAENLMAASKTANEAAQTATKNTEAGFALVTEALTKWCAQVQQESGGDPAIIASTNLGVKSPPTPGGLMAQVQNLSVSEGDNPGELDTHWDPVAGRTNFEIQICLTDPTVEANWHLAASSRKSSATLTGLTNGTRVWVRVRAKAPKVENDGAWSQPAMKIVP